MQPRHARRRCPLNLIYERKTAVCFDFLTSVWERIVTVHAPRLVTHHATVCGVVVGQAALKALAVDRRPLSRRGVIARHLEEVGK